MSTTASTTRLLADYRAAAPIRISASRLLFAGVGDRDVYNVSGVFFDPDQERNLIAGRVEDRTSEHSVVMIFGESGGVWSPLPNAHALALQDPFIFQHRGNRYLGGVEIEEDIDAAGVVRLRWRTVVYDHRDLAAPKRIFDGPWGMKDLRFVDLADGRLGVFTRPQGGEDGRGRIGFTTVDDLTSLTHADIAQAPRLESLFLTEEWGGVNHAWLAGDNRVGILGHIARFDEAGERHYYPIAFTFDPSTGAYSTPSILFERRDLPDGPAKRPDLKDVIFPGWAAHHASETLIYCGVSDAEAYLVVIPGANLG